MKRTILIALLIAMAGTQWGKVEAACPWFGGLPSWGNVVGYNLNATPWNFILEVYGDTTGANIKWYTYDYGQQLKDTVLYTGKGSNTVNQCCPATDNSVPLNITRTYVCVVKTLNCPEGIIYKDAAAVIYGHCERQGSTFIIENAASSYVEGSQIKLTAYYDGQGGFHYYTWYKDGVAIDSTAEHQIWNDPDNFNYSVLTIPACDSTDAGTYSVYVSDGTDTHGTPCAMTVSKPKTITVTPKQPEPQCQDIVYRKWDNMLFVDNGKKEFASYQWYKDNTILNGETNQYLYTADKMQDNGHQYYVVATRNNGEQVKSCAGYFTDFTRSASVNSQTSRRVALYTNMGRKVGEWSDEPNGLTLAPGTYILICTDSTGQTRMKKIVY